MHLKSHPSNDNRRRRAWYGGCGGDRNVHASWLRHESRGAVRVCVQSAVFVHYSRKKAQRSAFHWQACQTVLTILFVLSYDLHKFSTQLFVLVR